MRMQVEAECSCDIEVGAIKYHVECLARGTCDYVPARLGGPPENCHPEESECDLEKVEITRACRFSNDVEIKNPQTLDKIEKALNEDWLIECLWAEYDVLSQAEAQGE